MSRYLVLKIKIYSSRVILGRQTSVRNRSVYNKLALSDIVSLKGSNSYRRFASAFWNARSKYSQRPTWIEYMTSIGPLRKATMSIEKRFPQSRVFVRSILVWRYYVSLSGPYSQVAELSKRNQSKFRCRWRFPLAYPFFFFQHIRRGRFVELPTYPVAELESLCLLQAERSSVLERVHVKSRLVLAAALLDLTISFLRCGATRRGTACRGLHGL